MKKVLFVLVMPGILLFFACGSTGKNFGKIYPGMTSTEVVKVMDKGPDRVENYEGTYAGWYYGEDLCLLLEEDKVLSKDKSREKSMLNVFGKGSLEKKEPASCVPPGYAKKKAEHEITTPFGNISK